MPLLTLQALLDTASLLGEQTDVADHAAQHHDVGVAVAVSAAVVVVGLVLAVQARSDAAATAFAVLVLPTLVLALLWVGTTPAPTPGAPVRSEARQGACQEHSGGDTRCPGG